MIRRLFLSALFTSAALMLFSACEKSSTLAGIAGPEGDVSTRLAGIGDCKSGDATLLAGEQDGGSLSVSVAADGKVSYKHQDAMFNCCIDSIALSVQLDGTSITITETEHANQRCHCSCPYDLDGEILGLQAGAYTVTICNEDGEEQCTAEVTVN
jgi:hypothetical protein